MTFDFSQALAKPATPPQVATPRTTFNAGSDDDPFSSPSPLLNNLNPEQLAAVTLPSTHALILAGAGSGKTRVLTTRIAWLMQTGQLTPGGVLAVTFTNKAAKEMLTRLGSMMPHSVRGMWVGTFHGLCNRFLRAHYKSANLPQGFQILDTQDQISAVKRLFKQFNVDDDFFVPKKMCWFFNACKEDGQRPKDVPVRDDETRKKVELYQLYEDQCQREGVVDFAELLLRTYELLRDNPAIQEHYQRRFRHILIDEFQDTNKLQYAWVKMFGGGASSSVFAVGDDDQSIYAFRGAKVGNMADFVREFQVTHQIKLERNYRSFGNILDSANALIANNKKRLGKNLSTERGPGEPVRVYESTSDFAEAQWMVEEMQALARSGGEHGDGFKRSELAVLYRSNAQSRVIETTLVAAGIPYRVYGGLRFFERAEIKHALAYLRLLENKHDDTSFMRVVNFPARGIGARSLEQLQDAARSSGCSLADATPLVTGKAGGNLSGFVAMIDVLREQTAGLTLREIIELVLDKSGLVAHFQEEKDGQDRVENLNELVNAAASFVTQEGFGRDAVALPIDEFGQADREARYAVQAAQMAGDALADPFAAQAGLDGAASDVAAQDAAALAADPLGVSPDGETLSPLAAFLTHAALEAGDNQAHAGQEAVQLMTVHSAKGLEFDCVFITGLEEGLFPHENSLSDWEGLEEERRLMYVAITRARQRLYLSHSQTRLLHGQTRYNIKSRFFEELPEAALKFITPKRAGFGNSAGQGFGGYSGGGASSNSGYGQGGAAWQGGQTGYNRGGQSGSASKPPQGEQDWTSGTKVTQALPAAANFGIRVGMQVFHNKFGEGKVLAIEGSGADARGHVNFNRHGAKWLALGVAKLTPVA